MTVSIERQREIIQSEIDTCVMVLDHIDNGWILGEYATELYPGEREAWEASLDKYQTKLHDLTERAGEEA